jgi:hypothetical protein
MARRSEPRRELRSSDFSGEDLRPWGIGRVASARPVALVIRPCGIVPRGIVIMVPSAPFDLIAQVGTSAVVTPALTWVIVFDPSPHVVVASIILQAFPYTSSRGSALLWVHRGLSAST